MLILALLEGSAFCAMIGGALLIWRPLSSRWTDVAAVAAGLSLCVVLGFSFAGLYNLSTVRNFQGLLRRVSRAFAVVAVLVSAFAVLVRGARLVESPIESGLLMTIAFVFGPFLPLRAVAYRVMSSRRFPRRLLIVGTSLLAWQLIEEVQARPDSRYVVAGVADGGADDDTTVPRDPLPESLQGLDTIIDRVRPDEIVLALSSREGAWSARELLEARVHRGIPVHNGVVLYERLAGKLPLEALTLTDLLFTDGFRQSRLTLAVRRGVSFLFATVGLVAAAPLLALIALIIKLDSRGPVLFAQQRIGFRGRPFVLLKFRTMHPVERPPSEWERDNGHRITRVGRWLRRFWLDELPQLVNILRGDMDFVGPRPHPVCNAELFTQRIPFYTLRMAVRPGLTGWAQVQYGYANDLDEEAEKMRYDLYYIKHQSLWLDLRVLLQTIKMIPAWRDVDREVDMDGRLVDVGRIAVLPTARASPAMNGNGAAPAGVGTKVSWDVSGIEHEANRGWTG